MESRRDRAGLTIVDLLVCIGIIGLLMSLLLPALQAARGSARKLDCLNRIRQLALASQEFESAHGKMPKTGSGFDAAGEIFVLSPHVSLLPYLEQRALFEAIDMSETASGRAEPPSSRRNAAALSAFVQPFVCPDDDMASGGHTNYRACMAYGPAVIVQPRGVTERENGSGPWRYGRGADLAGIRDGLSNTILFGEKLVGDSDATTYTPWRDSASAFIDPMTIAQTIETCSRVPTRPAQHRSYGGKWLFGGFHATWYNHVLTPNSPTPDCGEGGGAVTARSFHQGGVNVSLADGSGRFIADEIETEVWRALASRDRGDAVTF